jgi:8-oxo-dGTP pyrophosphatase MutT (NUDIX family)
VSEPHLGTAAGEAELAALLARRPLSRQGDLDPRLRAGVPERLVPAAVLVLLERGPRYSVVFTKRTHHVMHHKGEVSFAGGMRDPEDADLRATALREAHEEIGLPPQAITLLGELDQLVTVTGFEVTPVVGVTDAGAAYWPSPVEVDRVLQVPMEHLRDPSHWFEEDRTWRGQVHRLRSCRYGEDVIWGATSRILQNFLAVVPPHLLP